MTKKILIWILVLFSMSALFLFTDTTRFVRVEDSPSTISSQFPKLEFFPNASSSSPPASYETSVMTRRLNLMSETCARIGSMNSKDLGYNWEEKHLNQFIYGPKKILAYCHIPKAASTWWLSVFAASFGYPEKEIDRMDKTMSLHVTMLKTAKKAANIAKDSFKFIFVRHPIDRIISAYTNKYFDVKEGGFIRTLEQYSKSKGIEKDHWLDFSNYVDFILDESEEGKISFGTLHWLPYTNICDICNTDLQMIGKLETFEADISYMSEKFPHMRSYFKGSKRNAALAKPSKRRQGLTTAKLLSQLTKKQRIRLCKLYKWDLIMFDYDCFPQTQ